MQVHIMGAWLESALLLAILLVIFVTTSAWNENGTFVRGCNFEVRNTTYENWSRTYSLLTIPPLKSIEYPNVESQFYWLSLSRIPEFEARDISIDVVERFCALPRSRYVYVSADTYERPDMAIINNIKLHLLAEPLESFHNDEEYILNINTTSISLSACSERGILYGLGTLGQLLESPNPIALPVTIHDWPELPWRGTMRMLCIDSIRCSDTTACFCPGCRQASSWMWFDTLFPCSSSSAPLTLWKQPSLTSFTYT